MLALQAGCIAASKAGDEPWHADICHYVNNHTGSCCRLPEEELSWTASGTQALLETKASCHVP